MTITVTPPRRIREGPTVADSGRTVYGGGAASGGLRVPPSSEVGVPLGSNPAAALTAGQTATIEWTDDDDAGTTFPAGAVAFPDQKLTLAAAHLWLTVDEDGYYQIAYRVTLTAGGSGADVRVAVPPSGNRQIHLPASAQELVRDAVVWPYAGGNINLSVTCIAGSVTVGYCTLYVKRLSE